MNEEERAERQRLFDEFFATRHWRVMTETSGPADVPGSELSLIYDQGFFRFEPPGGAYLSPVGQKARTGFLIREIDADGIDLEATAAFPRPALDYANATYPGAVSGLPATPETVSPPE